MRVPHQPVGAHHGSAKWEKAPDAIAHRGPLQRSLWNRKLLAEPRRDLFPIHQIVEERLDVVGAAVAIVDVVGMLPDVAAEQRLLVEAQRVHAVRRVGALQLAALFDEPAPAAAELADAL